MRASAIVALLVVLAFPVSARADDVTSMYPWMMPASDDIKGLVDAYAACGTANHVGGLNFSGGKLSGANVYEIDPTNKTAPNADAYGGSVTKTGGGVVKYVAIKKATFPSNPSAQDCVSLGALLLHELHHVWAWEWYIGQCAGQPNPSDCIQCIVALDQCMRDNDPSGQGKNQLEESRANFATALCLCKKACELPEGSAERKKLEDQAGVRMSMAAREWGAGVAAWNACSGSHGACGLPTGGGPPGYPMPPLNPGGSPPVQYGGPWPDPPGTPPQPKGGSFQPPPPAPAESFTCDCNYTHHPDYDPCDSENEED